MSHHSKPPPLHARYHFGESRRIVVEGNIDPGILRAIYADDAVISVGTLKELEHLQNVTILDPENFVVPDDPLDIKDDGPSERGLFLLMLFTAEPLRDAMLGCACERFNKDAARWGLTAASFVFWWDILLAALHFAGSRTWRPAAAILGALGLGKLLGH